MLGIGRDALTTVASLPESEAMDMAALERQLAAGEGRPTLVLASAGTVNTVAFDDLPRLLALRERYPFWLHVDAAFGGVAACSPLYAPRLAGWQQADSITVDAHKWLNVPYDSAINLPAIWICRCRYFRTIRPTRRCRRRGRTTICI